MFFTLNFRLWDDDSEGMKYNTYGALKKEVEQSRKESGGTSNCTSLHAKRLWNS